MKKKLTEKDLTQIVRKVINEIDTFDILKQREREVVNYEIFDKLAEYQALTRNRKLYPNDIVNIIEILYNEIELLRKKLKN